MRTGRDRRSALRKGRIGARDLICPGICDGSLKWRPTPAALAGAVQLCATFSSSFSYFIFVFKQPSSIKQAFQAPNRAMTLGYPCRLSLPTHCLPVCTVIGMRVFFLTPLFLTSLCCRLLAVIFFMQNCSIITRVYLHFVHREEGGF